VLDHEEYQVEVPGHRASHREGPRITNIECQQSFGFAVDMTWLMWDL